MKITIDNEEFIDAEEVARRMNIAISTLQVKQRAKEIPLPIKLKAYTFWKVSEIEEYLKNQKEEK